MQTLPSIIAHFILILRRLKHSSCDEVDRSSDNHPSTSIKTPTKKYRYFVGWRRFGIAGAFIFVLVVFVLNISFTLWKLAHKPIKHERGILHESDCDQVRHLNITAHVIINILSTIFLASSNYCMQCLSALTRPEMDKEYAQGRWLDIGILSVRNIRRINRKRALLSTSLGVSSLLLHLL